jgi:hypothetical protein
VIRKYPRTRHIEGSRLQPGDSDLDAVPRSELAKHHLVIEEKLDGANAGISFDADGRLNLQSRGHFLVGGPRERHFALFKTWAQRHRAVLHERLEDRYVLYGEWLYAKHTIFYDALPHFFLEFDVLDRETESFLSTPKRHELLRDSPIQSVPVLAQGELGDPDALVQPSLYKTEQWRDALCEAARYEGLDVDRVVAETDPHDLSEGLYIKAEDDDRVIARYKYVRASFLTSVVDSGSHWHARPIVPNRLARDIDIFAEVLP